MQERLYVVIDQSGSMKKMNDSVYKGVQELIDVCSDDTMIVIITFNNDVKFVYRGSKRDMHDIDFRNSTGSTRLYDAVIATMMDIGTFVGKCSIVLCTDGIDTSSTHTQYNAKDCIEKFKINPNNRITFLGVNQDAILNATAIGIPAHSSISVGTTHGEIISAYRSTSANMTSDTGFTQLQRQMSLVEQIPPPLQRQTSSAIDNNNVLPPPITRSSHI